MQQERFNAAVAKIFDKEKTTDFFILFEIINTVLPLFRSNGAEDSDF
jgi:hypothetical protein